MSLFERLRAIITLHRFQAIVGITAGFLAARPVERAPSGVRASPLDKASEGLRKLLR